MFQRISRIALAAFAAALISSSNAFAQTGVSKTNDIQGSFDASSGVRTFEVTAADMSAGAVVSSVEISIDFEKFDGQTFGQNPGGTPFYNEIFFSLTNPGGVTSSLIAANSFQPGANGFRGIITFGDAAPAVVNADPSTPVAGFFRPTGPGTMLDLNSASGIGTWTLNITDTVGSDQLGFYSSTLNLNGGGLAVAVPEAGTLALFPAALGMIGAVVIRRRKK